MSFHMRQYTVQKFYFDYIAIACLMTVTLLHSFLQQLCYFNGSWWMRAFCPLQSVNFISYTIMLLITFKSYIAELKSWTFKSYIAELNAIRLKELIPNIEKYCQVRETCLDMKRWHDHKQTSAENRYFMRSEAENVKISKYHIKVSRHF